VQQKVMKLKREWTFFRQPGTHIELHVQLQQTSIYKAIYNQRVGLKLDLWRQMLNYSSLFADRVIVFACTLQKECTNIS
jgi:hypothetical protein